MKTAKESSLAGTEHPTLEQLVKDHLLWLETHNYAEKTVLIRTIYIGDFVEWCRQRELVDIDKINRSVLEEYQRALFTLRQRNGKVLSFATQRNRLVPLRTFFRWLVRQDYLEHDPASLLEMPRMERRLPKHTLTAKGCHFSEAVQPQLPTLSSQALTLLIGEIEPLITVELFQNPVWALVIKSLSLVSSLRSSVPPSDNR